MALAQARIKTQDQLEGSGVVVFASKQQRFLRQAVACAASIRRNSPNTKIALVTDLQLDEWEIHQFTKVFHISFDSYPGIAYRFSFDRLAPFKCGNLILDSDSLVYQPLDELFDRLEQFGTTSFEYPNKTGGHWFTEPSRARALNEVRRLPLINGDTHFVVPDDRTRELFDVIRSIASQYDERGIRRWRGGVNDEPVFSLAYRELDWSLMPRDLTALGNTAAWECVDFRTNCIKGIASLTLRNGEVIPTRIIHFESFVHRPAYLSDQARLLSLAKHPNSVFRSKCCEAIYAIKAAIHLGQRALNKLGRSFESNRQSNTTTGDL